MIRPARKRGTGEKCTLLQTQSQDTLASSADTALVTPCSPHPSDSQDKSLPLTYQGLHLQHLTA